MTLWIVLLVLLGVVLIVGAVGLRFYVKAPPNAAFIRTGLGGKRVVIDRGAIVLPIVHHIQWLSLETFKLDVVKVAKEAFITKDRYRVDIGAEFYIRIGTDPESIEKASRSLGDKSFSADGIRALVEEKLVGALRSVAAATTLVELHENRRGFAVAVKDLLLEPLSYNGLTLEDVSVFHLDQTSKEYLDPSNIFDAEGLKRITLETSERTRERNEIERNTEVAIRRQDVEAVKLKLALDQEREFAEAEQQRRIETYRTQQLADTAEFKFQSEQRMRTAEIAKERNIREAEILRDQAIREAEVRREIQLISVAEEQERAQIAKERAVEEAKRAKEIAVLLKEVERLAQETARLQSEAEKEAAEQAVVSVKEKAQAERAKEIALIHALRELEVAERRAQTAERLARARRAEGEAEAYAVLKMREAENALADKLIVRELARALIDRAPEIVAELMAPAKQIESIRVLDIHGLGTDSGGDASGVAGVLSAFLRSSAALPLLREILDFAGVDRDKVVTKLTEKVPFLREVTREGATRDTATR
ncbi:Inner membrane protein YqiK [bacterium HR30]|nr:Inner membrane protein YqiK [bacterium HR30]